MGHDSRKIGTSGEYLFGFLADTEWNAEFAHTPAAEATDGYLVWREDPLIPPLWVQVKTQDSVRGSGAISVPVRKPRTLQCWAARGGVLLVVCDLSKGCAWWHFTREVLDFWCPPEQFTFHVSRTQPVARSTTDLVRKIARAVQRNTSHVVLQPPLRSLSSESERLTVRDIRGIIENTYVEMSSRGIVDRDIMALGVSRLVWLNATEFSHSLLENLIGTVATRLLSNEWGGRSSTLAAVLALLACDPPKSPPSDVVPLLRSAALHAVQSNTFLNPEFGLLIAAFAADTSLVPADRDFLESVARDALLAPRNNRVSFVANAVLQWLETPERPLSTIFTRDELHEAIYRPLPLGSEVRINPDSGPEAVTRILAAGVDTTSADDLRNYDEHVRLKAAEFLKNL